MGVAQDKQWLNNMGTNTRCCSICCRLMLWAVAIFSVALNSHGVEAQGDMEGVAGRLTGLVDNMGSMIRGPSDALGGDSRSAEAHRRDRASRVSIDNDDPPDPLPPVDFPPINPFISQGAWPTVHASSYAQGSSANCAPNERDPLTHDFIQNVQVLSNPITIFYTNDNEHMWGVSWTAVFRLKRSARSLVRESSVRRDIEDIFQDVFHGAYSILDRNEVFYTATANRLEAYFAPPVPFGGTPQIEKFHTDFVLQNARSGEVIRALVMTHDGYLAFCTNLGLVGIVKRLFPPHLPRSIPHTDNLPLSDRWSSRESMAPVMTLVAVVQLGVNGDGEEVPLEMSNNIAADEDGGIYIVTNEFMHKVAWDKASGTLGVAWESVYASPAAGATLDRSRLGSGSGSTPSIMGDKRHGRYIVITDGEEVMNVVVLNADSGVVEDRYPVTFGLVNPNMTLSEQSVLVYGWRFVVVNNTPRDTLFSNLPLQTGVGGPPVFDSIANALPVIVGEAPYGVEQFEFTPRSTAVARPPPDNAPQHSMNHVVYRGSIRSVWANTEVSIPNGIPTMSGPEHMMYGIGKRPSVPVGPNRAGPLRGTWTLEGIDWWTGESRFHYNLGVSALYNSVFAGTEIGPDCEIVTGTLGGVVRIRGFGLGSQRRRREDVRS